MLCTEMTLVKDEGRQICLTPIRCRRWSCDYCNPWRKRQLIAQAAGGRPDTFLTLTSSPATANSPENAARVLVVAWRKVRAEACKRHGYTTIPFIAVFEATKHGAPHLHILLRCKWLDHKWLSERMEFHARAPIVHIKRVADLGTMARYLAKYVGKAPHHFGTCKRYWASRDYEVGKGRASAKGRAPEDRCFLLKRGWESVVADAYRQGYALTFEGDGVAIRQRLSSQQKWGFL